LLAVAGQGKDVSTEANHAIAMIVDHIDELKDARQRALESTRALRAIEHSYRSVQDASLGDSALPEPRQSLSALV